MKKTLVFLMMTLMFFGMVAGVTASESQGKVLELTLEQSIQMALDSEDNYDLRKAELDEDKAQRAVSGAIALQSLTQAEVAADVYMPQSVKDDKLYGAEKNIEMARLGLTLARKGIELKKTATQLAVEKQYYEVLKATKKVENLLAKVETSQQLIRQAEVKFKAGTVAKKDILDAEVQFARDRALVAQAQREKEVALLKFKRLIGVDLDTQVNLVSNFTFEPKDVPSLQALVENAQEESFDVFTAKEKIDTCDDLLKRGKNKNWTGTTTYADIEFTRDEAELTQKSAERNAELAAYQAYSLLKGAEDRVKVLEKSLELAKEGLRLTKLQYQAGLATSIMVNQAANALAEVQASALEALYDYNVVKSMIDHGIYQFTTAP